ncbi:MAG TPA: TetR/AcrR family transcriptional regulator [Roseiflexaceae bacterium]|nr:TetR/AcrR family transcriptional regulator [Roseiflexaceae bacterium]
MLETTRKDQIYEVAERLFSERGYHATTMREIARELQIEGGSLYSHISGKQELLYEIVLRGSEQFLRAARDVVAAATPARARLRELMRRHLAIMAQSTPRAIVHFHEWRHLDVERQAAIRARRDEYESYVRRIIREGVVAGDFASGDERLIGLHVLSLLNWTYQWYAPGGTLNADDLADQFFDLLMRGLEPR